MTTTSGVGGFVGDLKKAKSKLTDTAGIRLRGTHVFAVDDLVDYVIAYADAQGRPVFTPTLDDNRLPIRSVGDQAAEGYSGYVVSGLAMFGDSNIGVRCYVSTITRLPAGVSVISGSAYAASTFA